MLKKILNLVIELKNKNILFRADSSSEIGIGHIKRDLVLAQQYVNNNINFATLNLKGNINDEIRKNKYKVYILKSNKNDELINIIIKKKIDFLIIDHYDIKYEDEKYIKEKTNIKIMCLDDIYEKHYCDILLNHNVYAKKNDYKKLLPSFCKIKCGKKYTLLRDEFKIQKNKKNSKLEKRIFISIGGADSLNINIKILKILVYYKDYRIDIVTTHANKNLDDLKKYVSKFSNIYIYIDFNNIAKLMNKCSFAIITPSLVANEAIYLNKKIIVIKVASNQKYMYKYLKSTNNFVMKKYNKNKLYNYLQKIISE